MLLNFFSYFFKILPAASCVPFVNVTTLQVDNQPSFVPCINFTITIAFFSVSVVAERMMCSRATQWLVVDNWTLERL
tara:strand:+ start:112 stop:342 length:231 start_codon:yes stop_codon:yes gene_type:complete